MNKHNFLKNEFKWPITRKILFLILEDKVNKTVLAVMKVGKRWSSVKEILEKEKIINKALIALNVGMPDQIIQDASKYNLETMPYFSLILIRPN